MMFRFGSDDSGHREGLLKSPKAKALSGVLVLVAVAATVVEMFVLRGDRIAYERFRIQAGGEMTIAVAQPGEPYRVDIYTSRARALRWTLLDPEGETLVTNSEMSPHEGTRGFSFAPEAVGDYRLQVGPRSQVGAGPGGSLTAKVFLNDRRILTPLVQRLKF